MEIETLPSSTPEIDETTMLDQLEAMTGSWGNRPSWDAYFMATALLMASRSSCERLHVGCVIVSGGAQKNRIVAAGYNGFLPGAPHASRVRDGHEQATVHAEQNAICDAARRGVPLDGATVYVTHFPCINCAKILAATGISCIKYRRDYRNDDLVKEILSESGVGIEQL
ncbi:MAG: cytidine/deoxycytidylate deaminase family protein [Opitutales bacterium]|jgi:dCMP deaminase|nr:cytidine/deoxycytidylate deaminase family protein [Opitutales bacterium]MDP4643201.1 cytidine/deoxycytidylate deaminase family protein [Opitutales bacterium]MDP4693859.1 cytidine/deoxycytidylate deaminase family protein [Opitutales bacterium]MDP4776499.1 cytidine/deoxycytidylate deaminase family protein [Opitutales bacterium]MDP4882598.1 cytidine/deoxycytidylate deaminase family protein [Opitutales bacterium]